MSKTVTASSTRHVPSPTLMFPSCCAAHSCLERDDVPAVFVEPFIKHGYRPPNRPVSYYFASLFFNHNEVLNMWTALLGILGHLYLFKSCPYIDTLWVLNFAGACIHIFSFMAHTFSHMNAKVHIACYLLDFLGIYLGFSQVFPSFLVLHFNVSPRWAVVAGLATTGWTMWVYWNCCYMYIERWKPWFDGGDLKKQKPRVLYFVQSSVWLHVIFWLSMNVMMAVEPPASGSNKAHLVAMLFLILEGLLLQTRIPERWVPDYFSAFRSHPFTHICAATVTIGLVMGFLQDKASLGQTELPSDPIFLFFSLSNILYCFTLSFKTIRTILNFKVAD